MGKNLKKIVIGFASLISLLVSSYTTQATVVNISMPGGVVYYCENLAAPDTFVFHKPLGFGSTMWYVGATLLGSGDSMIYVPSTVGSFAIASTWNGNGETCNLNIFNAVPPHPMIQITSGATFNSNHDTVRMCASSVSILANINGANLTYINWVGPSGLIATTANTTITSPGTYILVCANTCGLTKDTLHFVNFPYVLPNIGSADTTFCNLPVNLLLNPGPGWNYTWTGGSFTGLHTQTIQLSTNDTGTYSVQLSNMCMNGSRTIKVHRQVYPTPAMKHMVGAVLCADSVVTLNPASGYHYESYTWSTGAHTDSIQISGLTTGGGLFTVTVTQGVCSETAYDAYYQFYQPPQRPEICIVTVDSALQKNIVVWTTDAEPSSGSFIYSPTASYNIYKDNDTINPIGSIGVHDQHVYADTLSTPTLQSATYYVQAVDECDVKSQVSNYHQTILLQTSQGSLPGQVNLTWNQYQDQSGGLHISNYDIWRGSSMNSLSFYKNVSAPVNPNLSVMIVDTVSSQQYYLIVATKTGGCDPTAHFNIVGLKGIEDGTIRSNVKEGTTTVGIQNINHPIFSVYPNPVNDKIFIKSQTTVTVKLMDITGKILLNTQLQNGSIDVSEYPVGLYLVQLQSVNGGMLVRKVVKE